MATWRLDPDFRHLNHGSFGATPIEVLAEQEVWRARMEANPVSFMLEVYQPALDDTRRRLANFLHVDPSGLVFVENATVGVNSVLRSIESRLRSGDEVVITNHGYNACNNAAVFAADKQGARVVVAEVPFPVDADSDIVESVLAAVTARTRLVIVDHVTSPTGVVFPIARIIETLEPDVPVLIDGAHAPGMVDVDLGTLGASFYTANCHKWLCAPKGSGFLHVAERHREWMSAAVISHGQNNGWPGSDGPFHARFDWTGTSDPTPWLSVGAAIDVMGNHRPDGWDGIRRANHEMALHGRSVVLEAVGSEPPVPDEMIGSIASIHLPAGEQASTDIFDPLMVALRRKWRIEIPVFSWPDRTQRLLRISAQQYNSEDDYSYLAEALRAEL